MDSLDKNLTQVWCRYFGASDEPDQLANISEWIKKNGDDINIWDICRNSGTNQDGETEVFYLVYFTEKTTQRSGME